MSKSQGACPKLYVIMVSSELKRVKKIVTQSRTVYLSGDLPYTLWARSLKNEPVSLRRSVIRSCGAALKSLFLKTNKNKSLKA